jgi:hypothetical protein
MDPNKLKTKSKLDHQNNLGKGRGSGGREQKQRLYSSQSRTAIERRSSF